MHVLGGCEVVLHGVLGAVRGGRGGERPSSRSTQHVFGRMGFTMEAFGLAAWVDAERRPKQDYR